MKRTPLRRVSKKRAKANAEYSKRRKAFLEAHPFCQWWIRENASDTVELYGMMHAERLAIAGNGLIQNALHQWKIVPRSTDIHHMKGRTGNLLNDERYWMAVSRGGHTHIHRHGNKSREKGYILT